MWNFGCGVAVAGLSATYYALARKNIQLERENAINNRMDGKGLRLTPSAQLLLKTEQSQLSRGSGHKLGLNVVEDKLNNVETVKSTTSGFELKGIISRVQTGLLLHPTTFDGSSDEDETNSEEKTPESQDRKRRNKNFQSAPYAKDDPIIIGQFTPQTSSQLVISESAAERELDFCIQKYQTKNAEGSHPKVTIRKIPNGSIERTKSPVVYYKNPDFGKRSANRNSLQLSDIYVSPGFDMQNISYFGKWFKNINNIKDDTKNEQEEDTYSDSTRFIFPPVLSESKLSVCEEEEEGMSFHLPEIEIARSSKCDKEMDISMNECCLRTEENEQGSQMDEIRDYNMHLQIHEKLMKGNEESETISLPEHFQTADDLFDMITPPDEIGDSRIEENKENAEDSPQGLRGNGDHGDVGDIMSFEDQASFTTTPEMEETEDENKFPKLCSASSTSVIGRIPSSSWIGWPARLYSESEMSDEPWKICIFLSAVIIVTVILGKIFICMGEWFELVNDIEYNPHAIMEH